MFFSYLTLLSGVKLASSLGDVLGSDVHFDAHTAAYLLFAVVGRHLFFHPFNHLYS